MSLTIGRINKEYWPAGVTSKGVADLREFNGKDVYGVRYNPLRRVAAPVCNSLDMIWTPATQYSSGVDDYKNVAPFNVRKCITDVDTTEEFGRVVLAYEDEDDYETLKTEKTGDRMVEFPKGYYYRPDPWTFLVSPTKIDERWKVSPAHDLGSRGEAYKVRRSEFTITIDAEENFRSLASSRLPLAGLTLQEFITGLRKKYMYVQSYGFWSWFNILSAIKHSSFNSQLYTGYGYVLNTNNMIRTLHEDSIQGLDGYTGLELDSNNGYVRTLGVQDFYGVVNKFLGNVFVTEGNVLNYNKNVIDLITLPTEFKEEEGWLKINTGMESEVRNQIWKAIGYDENDPGMLFCSEVMSTFGKFQQERRLAVGDDYDSKVNTPYSVVMIGGKYNDVTLTAGSMRWDAINDPTFISNDTGVGAIEFE